MAERQYRKLQGMELAFVTGVLEENSFERAIGYSVTFRMSLDFTHFVHMANQYIEDYLNNPLNAIRPELEGLAYHYSYNYLFWCSGQHWKQFGLVRGFSPIPCTTWRSGQRARYNVDTANQSLQWSMGSCRLLRGWTFVVRISARC